MRSKLVNCLICNSSLNQNEFSNKLDDVDVYDQDKVDSKKCLQFKLGLQLLNKFLSEEGLTKAETIKKSSLLFGGDDNGGGGRSPACCEECGAVFGEMIRLHHAIEEMQISLMKQVDKLKDSLLKSGYQEDPLKLPDDCSGLLQLRNSLLSQVRSQDSSLSSLSHSDQRPHRKKRRLLRSPSPPSSPRQPLTKQPKSIAPPKLQKEYQPCSVILTRLPPSQLTNLLKPATIKINDDDKSLSKQNESPAIHLNTRKSKLKAIQFINQQISSSSSPKNQTNQDDFQDDEFLPPSPSETGSNQDNYLEDSGDDYPWETEAILDSPSQKYSSPLTPSLQKLSKPSKKFYLISPSTLLYRYTLIKVTQGFTQFTCQAPECPSPIFSDPSLNWTNLFYLIADHIEISHYPPQKSDPLTLPQKCPLCPFTLPQGPSLRSHLIKTGSKTEGHCIQTVVCETCWKPMRNVADFYRVHQWHHKNPQEKEETPGGPPPKIKYLAKKKLATKHFKKNKNKVSQDPSILEAISVLNKVKSGAWSKKPKMKKKYRNRRTTAIEKLKQVKSPKIKVKLEECLQLTTPSPKGMSKFIPLSSDTLLYQYTLIKVSPGYTQFTCQETDCPSPLFSSADYSNNELLNWRLLFDQIAVHIDSTHDDPLKSAVRECILCATEITGTAKDFRLHFTRLECGGGRRLAGHHRIQTVLCQICLKPLKHVADFFRCHQWSHKNNQEKKMSEEGPPPKVKHAEKQKWLKRNKLKSSSSSSHGQLDCVDRNHFDDKLEPHLQNVRKPSNLLSKFLIISEHTLLYKYTLIKVSQGFTQFTCQESQCPSPIFFTDELQNWTCLFNQIASHIDSTHGNPLSKDVRECCVCNTKLDGLAKNFRSHMTRDYCGGHWIKKIICEVCLMPMKNMANFYKCHQWSHKNTEEKEKCEDGPPPTPPPPKVVQAAVKQKTLKKKQLTRGKPLSMSRDQLKCKVELEAPSQIENQIESKRLSKFYVISEDTLLYHCTLFKVSEGFTKFTCQERRCPSPNFFTDELLNWTCLFDLIAGHIELQHGDPNESAVRECVLCATRLTCSAKEFRHHFTGVGSGVGGGHQIKEVICEICLKPMRNVADLHKCHQWSHKTKQERMACPEGPPGKIKYAKQKYLQKKGQITVLPRKDKLLSSSSSSSPRKLRYSAGLCDNFARIGMGQDESPFESLLLYKYTFLKALYGVSLSCQESNCDHIINGTDFTAFDQFKKHVKDCHHDDIAYEDNGMLCPLCGENIGMSVSTLRRHLLEERHSSECRFICTTCWKPFKQHYSLKCHEWSHKSDTDKETSCEEPPPIQKKKGREESQVCPECKKEYTSEYRLKCHLLTHLPKEQRKRYMCHQCPMLFLSAVAVRAHVERAHQRELMRMRSCPICSKEYNWRDGYKFRTHVRSHKNERNWICDKCGMGFLNTTGLRVHTDNVHGSRERRFQCEFCEMNYLNRKSLTRHRKAAHKDKVVGVEDEKQRLKFTLPEYRSDFIGPRIQFPCPVCEKVFPLRSRMTKHLKEYCKAARQIGKVFSEGN